MTIIRFGNLSVKQLADRCKLNLNEEEVIELENYRSDAVKLENNKFHIYDLPLVLEFKGSEVGEVVLNILGSHAEEFTDNLRVVEEEK